MHKVYLAGPDIFFPDAEARYNELKRLCSHLGLEGVQPSDGDLPAGVVCTAAEMAERIYQGNVRLITACDAVVANLTPFRNALEPDSGTVFEVGLAVGQGKPTAGYLPNMTRNFADKVIEECGSGLVRGSARYDARHDCLIEDFGQPLNLMLARSTRLFETAEEALAHLAFTLRGN